MDRLEDVGMLDGKGAPTPMTSTTILTASVNDPPADGTLYRRVIGKLHYLSFTRPDISFTVSKLSQFMQNPPTLTGKQSSDYFVIFVTPANTAYRLSKLHILVWLFIHIQIGLMIKMISLLPLAISLSQSTHQFHGPSRNNTQYLDPL
ncbi:uncharacterized protein LOC107009901 [Solanum pennellii]|uniref:Uncharacterized protein LOC107009901 n=1 Tax=Solanum pennellii TaxID=28526 RepID=A0ABM1G1N8_SOLPN|nr:uncharacterized protein LOC107009901 [Solanum pennellii]